MLKRLYKKISSMQSGKFLIIFICIVSLTSLSARSEQIQIEKIGPTLKNPWGMDFLNDQELLITEKRGRIYHVNVLTESSSQIFHKRGWVKIGFS